MVEDIQFVEMVLTLGEVEDCLTLTVLDSELEAVEELRCSGLDVVELKDG